MKNISKLKEALKRLTLIKGSIQIKIATKMPIAVLIIVWGGF